MSRFKKIIKEGISDLNTEHPSVRIETESTNIGDDPQFAPRAEIDIHEEYKKIKAQLIASKNTDRPIQSLLVTGSVYDEGATTLAITLAHAMATGNSYRTLLVDCNLKRPSIHKYLKLRNEVGLSELLSSEIKFDLALQEGNPAALRILTAGRQDLDISNLHRTGRYREFLRFAKNHFQYIIFDGPPISESFDTLIIGASLDTVIFVVRADQTPVSVTESAYEQLLQANLHVFGAVLSRKKNYVPDFLYKDYFTPSAK